MVTTSLPFWGGRVVLVTGHTGFKGGWLSLLLSRAGAQVHGYALDPPTEPSIFQAASIASLLASDTRADLADLDALRRTMDSVQPEVVFHLAAQPLVRVSYRDPAATFATNVMGTANVMEAVRTSTAVRALVAVTTDKVYENRNWEFPYRENDPLGGHDPYSASKAAAELVAASYRASFFSREEGHAAAVATARAGNVVGGGDWANDRLVPDCLRAFAAEQAIQLRYPLAVRPWQHVLEPLAGYIQLAERLAGPGGKRFAKAWNFGPDTSGDATVGRVAEKMAALWGDGAKVALGNSQGSPHEAGLLRLDSTQARIELGWLPRWSLDEALDRTVAWQRAWSRGRDMRDFSLQQVQDYESAGCS